MHLHEERHEIKTFWDKQEHVAVCQETKTIGTLFGKYLYPHCSLDSQRPGYIFTIEEEEMKFCMNTIIKIFGLG